VALLIQIPYDVETNALYPQDLSISAANGINSTRTDSSTSIAITGEQITTCNSSHLQSAHSDSSDRQCEPLLLWHTTI